MKKILNLFFLSTVFTMAHAEPVDTFEVFATLTSASGLSLSDNVEVFCRDGNEPVGEKESWGHVTLQYDPTTSSVRFGEFEGLANFTTTSPIDGFVLSFTASDAFTDFPQEDFSSRSEEVLSGSFYQNRYPAFTGTFTETRTTTRLSDGVSATCHFIHSLYGGAPPEAEVFPRGFRVFSQDELVLFVPSLHRQGRIILVAEPGPVQIINDFDPESDVVDFSVLLSSLYKDGLLDSVHFSTQVDGDDLVLNLQRTDPSQLLAEVRLVGLAELDLQDLDILMEAQPFSDWFFPVVKLLSTEAEVSDYLHAFRVDQAGFVQYAYTYDEQVRIDVKSRVVAADGDYAHLLGERVEGSFTFILDIRQGSDEFSQYENSEYDPRYSLSINHGLASASFGIADPVGGFDGVHISYEPFFNWLDELEVSTPEEAVLTEKWQEYLSYMQFPSGKKPIPGPYHLLEFLAFSTEGELDPETGKPILIEKGVEIGLIAATTPDKTFENWFEWFPGNAEFMVFTGEIFGEPTLEGEENKLGMFAAVVDEINVSSGTFSMSYTAEIEMPKQRRTGLPVWLLGTINESQ